MQLTVTLSILATLACSTIAANAVDAAAYHVEYAFEGGSDAASPSSPLMEYAGKLYGTTGGGGGSTNCQSTGCGTVYSFDPASGVSSIVYSFNGGSDGAVPAAGLIKVGRRLYGTTVSGGDSTNCPSDGGCGTVFWVDPATGSEKVVYSFKGDADGAAPWSSLIEVGGMLYGTTRFGGADGLGTVFSLNPKTGAEAVVYSFKGGADGAYSQSNLIVAEGALYGTTQFGGILCNSAKQGCGTVFSVDPATGAETVLYSFKGGADGLYPYSGLLDVGGLLYGTTFYGGNLCNRSKYGCGTVFSLDPTTGAEAVVYTFKGASGNDGSYPFAGLVEVGGILYGTTSGSSANRSGTVFSIDPTARTESVLHGFKGGADGSNPWASLLYQGQRLYGTTFGGGGSQNCGSVGCGTIFSIRP